MKILDQFTRKHITKNRNLYKSIHQPLCLDKNIFNSLILVSPAFPAERDLIEKGVQFLKQHFKKVEWLSYSDLSEAPDMSLKHYSKEDFSIFRWLKHESWDNEGPKYQADLLLVYNPSDQVEIEVIASAVDATVRLGTSTDFSEMYNIVLDMRENRDFKRFLQQFFTLIKSFHLHG
jgi:hypothetical protein